MSLRTRLVEYGVEPWWVCQGRTTDCTGPSRLLFFFIWCVRLLNAWRCMSWVLLFRHVTVQLVWYVFSASRHTSTVWGRVSYLWLLYFCRICWQDTNYYVLNSWKKIMTRWVCHVISGWVCHVISRWVCPWVMWSISEYDSCYCNQYACLFESHVQ